jgi:hypothetical protein
MNSSDDLNNELLTAYFDGELSPAEQREVEQFLFEQPESRRRIHDWGVCGKPVSRWGRGRLGRRRRRRWKNP